MHDEKVTRLQGNSNRLKRRPVLIVTEVEGAVVRDRRARRRRLVEHQPTMGHDELDLSLGDPVLGGRFREGECHTRSIVYDKISGATGWSAWANRGERLKPPVGSHSAFPESNALRAYSAPRTRRSALGVME